MKKKTTNQTVKKKQQQKTNAGDQAIVGSEPLFLIIEWRKSINYELIMWAFYEFFLAIAHRKTNKNTIRKKNRQIHKDPV